MLRRLRNEMSAPINTQIIRGQDGTPEYAVIPYEVYEALVAREKETAYVPHAVVGRIVDGQTPARAWREHLGLTQREVATRMGISQSAYAQQEAAERLRPATRKAIAAALGIAYEQLG